jgi:hypothetical protein
MCKPSAQRLAPGCTHDIGALGQRGKLGSAVTEAAWYAEIMLIATFTVQLLGALHWERNGNKSLSATLTDTCKVHPISDEDTEG